MKDLLEYIVKNIVTKPEAVSAEETNENGEVMLTLTVDPSDMGIVIGKSGQTIRSIRKLLTVRAIAENTRVNLQLAEPTTDPSVAPQDDNQAEPATSDVIPSENEESVPEESIPNEQIGDKIND